MRKKALLFIFEGYCEFEIAPAISMLRDSHELYTFSLGKTPCRSEAGLLTIPCMSVDEVDPVDFDMLIIPGGDLEEIAEADALFELAGKFGAENKITAAICSGVFVLARAGLLKDAPYTITLSKEQRLFLDCFEEELFSYRPVVSKGNVLTAQGHAYVEFGIALNKMVKEISCEKEDFYRGKGNAFMEQVQ
ncbi:putative intracellular protease/amidase [Bacillus tianshenii]|uniref:Intracellular protease/amidase n=1 Tax=Sutcliffiella tianshenii TaxID=1463404 RepID=A0ABS2P2A2_9BACI|nr:DJ-1/PfpI family protein [Bacillus tianshenii]MBM7621006.1 putative intracellular protease/amidase [Bacillus tianshenii]